MVEGFAIVGELGLVQIEVGASVTAVHRLFKGAWSGGMRGLNNQNQVMGVWYMYGENCMGIPERIT